MGRSAQRLYGQPLTQAAVEKGVWTGLPAEDRSLHTPWESSQPSNTPQIHLIIPAPRPTSPSLLVISMTQVRIPHPSSRLLFPIRPVNCASQLVSMKYLLCARLSTGEKGVHQSLHPLREQSSEGLSLEQENTQINI